MGGRGELGGHEGPGAGSSRQGPFPGWGWVTTGTSCSSTAPSKQGPRGSGVREVTVRGLFVPLPELSCWEEQALGSITQKDPKSHSPAPYRTGHRGSHKPSLSLNPHIRMPPVFMWAHTVLCSLAHGLTVWSHNAVALQYGPQDSG